MAIFEDASLAAPSMEQSNLTSSQRAQGWQTTASKQLQDITLALEVLSSISLSGRAMFMPIIRPLDSAAKSQIFRRSSGGRSANVVTFVV